MTTSLHTRLYVTSEKVQLCLNSLFTFSPITINENFSSARLKSSQNSMPTVDFWQIPGKQTSDYESTHQMELFGTHLATSNYSARSMMSSCMAKIKVNITAGSLRHWRGYRQQESHWTPTSVTEETKLASMLIRTRPRWSPRCHLCHSHQAEASQDGQ